MTEEEDDRPVVLATLLMSDRKRAITGGDGAGTTMHDGTGTLRAYCLGFDLQAEDLGDYANAATSVFLPDMVECTQLGELTSVVLGCIIDAFLTGYHTRRFEEAAADQEAKAA